MSVVPDHGEATRQVTAADVEADVVYATLRKSSRLATFHHQPANEYATLDGCSSGQTPDPPLTEVLTLLFFLFLMNGS